MPKPPGKFSYETAEKVAAAVVRRLSPYCHRIEVAGSIRRRRPRVNDIDIVLIPKDPWNLHHEILGLCKPHQPKMSGSKIMRITVNGIDIDIYFTDDKAWGMILLVRTGSTDHNIYLASRAKKLGLHFSVARGVEDAKGEVIASRTEEEIFAALGLDYLPPERREKSATVS